MNSTEGSVAQPVDATEVAEILQDIPRRLHQVMDRGAAETPDHPALVEDGVTWSYRQLSEYLPQVASSLEALGIRPGDRLMIVSENSIAMAALLLAASHVGAWTIVVNPRLSPRELDQIRDHSGARRMFFTAGVSKEAAAHGSRVNATIHEIGPLKEIAVSPLNESASVEPLEESSAQQVAVLIYTSGTTGTPKGVMLTHENLLFSAMTTARFRRLDQNDRVYVVLPISHIVGISLLLMTLMTGGTVQLVSRYDPANLVKAMVEDGITVLNGVPATYQRLLEYKAVARLPKLDKGKLRLMAVAGAPLDLNLKSRVEEELGLHLQNGYGITECAPGISGVRFDAPRADQAVGHLLPGVEARIVDREGAVVPGGTVGELHVRGRNVMRGYYRAPDLTAKAIDSEGWFNTGDLARFEGDCLFIAGRTKEMIIRSGFNVYPAEVEAVLNSHQAVVQSAVVGRSIGANEEVVAFVQLLKGTSVTPSELMSYAGGQLTSYKRPSQIIVLDTLPATSTGKILKHKLAESVNVA
jgi:acyl-CoA synthetase (AMP-forming)/AMP-acid ligase II